MVGCKGDQPCLHMHARRNEVRDTCAGIYRPRLHACMDGTIKLPCTCVLTLSQVPSRVEGIKCSISITHYTHPPYPLTN